MIQSLGPSGPSDPRRTDTTGGTAATRKATARPGDGAAAKTGAGQDKIELSQAAKDLQKVLRHLGDGDDVRAKRVEDIRRSIEAGTYRVDPESLAGKLLDAGLGS
jgi:negative regulator of flagellin synthesis FlgM